MAALGRRLTMIVRTILAPALFLCGLGAAHATSTLSCTADDKVLAFDAMAVVGHVRDNPILQFQGEIRLRLKDVPEDRRTVTLTDEHLSHRWLYGRDLKLLIFQEQAAGPFPWVELVVQTRRKLGEDADESVGTYRLTLPMPNPKNSSKTRDFTAQGRMACSVG